MEEKRSNNEIFKAMESIDYENQKLKNCLHEIVAYRKSLESKMTAAEDQLSKLKMQQEDLQTANAIHCAKIQRVEKEIAQLEKTQNNLEEAVKHVQADIKKCQTNFDSEIDKLSVTAEALCKKFLFAANKPAILEEEDLKVLDSEILTIKKEISEKETNILRMKRELEEFIPENPIESSVSIKDRQVIMDMVAQNLTNAKKQLDNLKMIKAEKDLKERELMYYS